MILRVTLRFVVALQAALFLQAWRSKGCGVGLKDCGTGTSGVFEKLSTERNVSACYHVGGICIEHIHPSKVFHIVKLIVF